jgi:hypothetical protein
MGGQKKKLCGVGILMELRLLMPSNTEQCSVPKTASGVYDVVIILCLPSFVVFIQL